MEKRKKHIARLPIVNYPDWKITTDEVAFSIPLFYSPVDSGLTDYDEQRIKEIHVKGAIWVGLSLFNNTDLADSGIGIYFHVEDKIYDLALEMFKAFDVPSHFVRPMSISAFLEVDGINSPQYGKKYMFLEDAELENVKRWVLMDSDAFVCTTGDKLKWANCFQSFENPSAMNVVTQAYATDKEYEHWVRMLRLAAGQPFRKDRPLETQEESALLELEFPPDKIEVGMGLQPRTYTCTQMFVLPMKHRIVDYFRRRWRKCYWDEGLLNAYQFKYGDVSFLPDKIGGLRKYQFESEYVNRDKSLDSQGYLAHLLPDDRVEMHLTDKYFLGFLDSLGMPIGTKCPEGPTGRSAGIGSEGIQTYDRPSVALAASSSDKERDGAHRYGKFYDGLFDRHFAHNKRPLRILEIGVSAFGGGSLEAWQSLKSVGKVVGIDTQKYTGRLTEKSTVYQTDAYTHETIRILKKTYETFDIIIDDGSHTQKDQRFFLRYYGDLLAKGGQLICEDVADDDFFREMCRKGAYGMDLSANRPEKSATSPHNDRILIKEKETSETPQPTQPKIFVASQLREKHHAHLLGVPYGGKDVIPTCAFDQRTRKSGMMWTDVGYDVTYYGHKDAQVVCTEHVSVTDNTVLKKSYGRADYNSVPTHKIDDHAFKVFHKNAEKELRKRVRENDLVLAFYGQGHKALCESISDLPVHIIEPSIGYPEPFSDNRVYQSVGYMNFIRGQGSHAYRLQKKFPDDFNKIHNRSWDIQSENEPRWNDTVIPNFFNVDHFPFGDKSDRENWGCYIGRIHQCKGLEIVFDIAEATDTHIKVAGPGDIHKIGLRVPKQVEFLGIADHEMRAFLLKHAKFLICPSLYLEPFLGVHIEAAFAGCPIITIDFGAPQEYCIDEVTGFRCMNMDDFMYAVRNLDKIDPAACRQHALQFTMKRAAISYHEYFNRVLRNNTVSWHSYDPERQRKDGLRVLTEAEINERYAEIQSKVKAAA